MLTSDLENSQTIFSFELANGYMPPPYQATQRVAIKNVETDKYLNPSTNIDHNVRFSNSSVPAWNVEPYDDNFSEQAYKF